MAGVGNAVNESGPAVAGQVVQMWPLSRFRPYDRNPRKNDHAVERVAAAIKEFGFKVPVLARSSGELIDGHLRLKAATFLGLESIPVLLADDLTDAQVRAFRISVNRMAELAEWDTDLLAAELDELAQLDVPVEMAGFEINDVFAFRPASASASDTAMQQEGRTKEVDVTAFSLAHRCPRCSFEFNDD